MKKIIKNQKEERPQVVMLLPRGASDLFFVCGSYPLRQWCFVSPPIQSERERNAQRSEEHVERKNVVREGVFGDGEDCQSVADREECPSEWTVAVWLCPNEHYRWNRREQVRDNRQVERVLGHLLVFANPQPHAEGQQTKHEASDLNSVWFRPPTMSSQDENGDEERVGEPEHCWPNVRFSTRTLVGKQECEADQRPERPARQIRLDLALIGSDAVRDDACHHQQPRSQANRFCTQATPPSFWLGMCGFNRATMTRLLCRYHSITDSCRQGQQKIRTFAVSHSLTSWIKKISFSRMQNRQFIFEPKIQYALTAERSEANLQNLQFPQWCPREDLNLYEIALTDS